ncbi:hypothetical protein CVV65_01680 [Kyrpidia spormannii]|uniref:Uncharacterized protein n=1 Tax=Kyrpidia spormannii TaxID=2055160 RepID=A0A2K8N2T0_9BACL|nr:hypothetical protein CVV65_01680 [Kyrpidia spormannii]
MACRHRIFTKQVERVRGSTANEPVENSTSFSLPGIRCVELWKFKMLFHVMMVGAYSKERCLNEEIPFSINMSAVLLPSGHTVIPFTTGILDPFNNSKSQ